MEDDNDDHAGRSDFWTGVILGYASGVLVAIIWISVVRFMSA